MMWAIMITLLIRWMRSKTVLVRLPGIMHIFGLYLEHVASVIIWWCRDLTSSISCSFSIFSMNCFFSSLENFSSGLQMKFPGICPYACTSRLSDIALYGLCILLLKYIMKITQNISLINIMTERKTLKMWCLKGNSSLFTPILHIPYVVVTKICMHIRVPKFTGT